MQKTQTLNNKAAQKTVDDVLKKVTAGGHEVPDGASARLWKLLTLNMNLRRKSWTTR